ncbi:TonB-dependent receptor domain-containing protein [Pedobacter sp. 22226]|uniref:TonB-dependent receptor domain-containing protein n=1 Tax=Pedobacter sp. 22226 TaxID=3453894 RepID=UPI003F825D12
MRILIIIAFFIGLSTVQAQYTVKGRINLGASAAEGVTLSLLPTNFKTQSNAAGDFIFTNVPGGQYQLKASAVGSKTVIRNFTLRKKDIVIDISMEAESATQLENVDVISKNEGVSGKLRQVEGTAIYASKKTEVINLANLNANLATNNARQVYGRIAGINIWEYDGGGVQLGIGGRGLNPSRVSNFNTRQNGYDISADALGYPESYYTPPTEALERIEIVRGAAGLQYGTQFGGMINFKLKNGPIDKPVEVTSRQTAGSYGFFNSFNSIGGTVKKLNYYAYYQYKRGDNFRPNSHFDQNGAYIHLNYNFSDKFSLTGEYTYMHYLAQQPGGLTDKDFNADPRISVRDRNWFKVNWNLMSLTADYRFSASTKVNWMAYHLKAGRDALGILQYIDRPDPGGARDMMADTYDNYGTELRVLHQYKLFNGQTSTLLTGVRAYHGLTLRSQGNADAGSGAAFDFLNGEPSSSQYRFPGQNLSVFTENIFQINDKWSITPGARFEYISNEANGYYYKIQRFVPNVKINESKQNGRSFVFFGIGTSFRPAKEVEIYANISQNYRSVNFNDIRVLNQNARVDSLLRDEKGYTADAGIRGKLKGWLSYDLSVFYLKYNDRIGSLNVKSEDQTETYRFRTNVADSRNIGFESLIEADFMKLINAESKYHLSAYSNLALIDARYINTQETAIKDKLVEFVPPLLFRTGLSFGAKKYDVSLQFSHVAKQYSDATNAEFTERAVDGVVPAYNVMDLSGSYNWKWFTLSGSINNLLNEKYFTRRADGYPGPGILPSDPRTYYLTLQVKL